MEKERAGSPRTLPFSVFYAFRPVTFRFRAAGQIPMPQAFFNSAVHWGQRVALIEMDEKQ